MASSIWAAAASLLFLACASARPASHNLDVVPCVRLLNSTGQSGCASPHSGVLAPLHLVGDGGPDGGRLESRAIAELASEARAWSKPRALLISSAVFDGTVLDRLESSLGDNLAGVLVLQRREAGVPPPARSPATVARDVKGHVWNPSGSGLLLKEYRFPVVLVGPEDAEALIARATGSAREVEEVGAGIQGSESIGDNPTHGPLVQFHNYMHARGTSQQCLPAGTCLPLGGQSVWALLGEGGTGADSLQGRPLVWLTARLDATSFFHEGASPGALSAVSGTVAGLAAAAALAQPAALALLQSSGAAGTSAQVALAWFHGESYGHIGSRRLVEDLAKPKACKRRRSPTAGQAARRPGPGGAEAEGEAWSQPCLEPFRASAKYEDWLAEPPAGGSSAFTGRDDGVGEAGGSGPEAEGSADKEAGADAPARAGEGVRKARPVRAVLSLDMVGAASTAQGEDPTPYLHSHTWPETDAAAAGARAETARALELLSAKQLDDAGATAYGRSISRATSAPRSSSRGSSGSRLPPTVSAGSFAPLARADPGGALLALAEYEEDYSEVNGYYMSVDDDRRQLKVSNLCDAADTVARAALLLAGAQPSAVASALAHPKPANSDSAEGTVHADAVPARVNCSLVEALLDCLLPPARAGPGAEDNDASGEEIPCALARELGVKGTLSSHYTGVYLAGEGQEPSVAPSAVLAQRLLASVLPPIPGAPSRRCDTDEDCTGAKGTPDSKPGDSDDVCIRGQCLRPTVYVHDSFSTGIERTADGLAWRVTDPSLPNWAEPYWGTLSTTLWDHAPSPEEGMALTAVGLFAGGATYAAVVLSRLALETVVARVRANRVSEVAVSYGTAHRANH